MITHEWHESITDEQVDQVEEMLDIAVAYDEEAGFSTAVPRVEGDDVHHLLVKMPPKGERGSEHLDRLPDAEVVAYLRVDVADGVGDVQMVVRPEFRSLGVATLLFERLAEAEDGWSSIEGLKSLRAWAHGAHPAAERMSLRFDGRLEHALFKTLRQIGGSRPFVADGADGYERVDGAEVPELVPGHDLTMAPGERIALSLADSTLADTTLAKGGGAHLVLGAHHEEPASRAAIIALIPDGPHEVAELRTLLTRGLLAVQEAGARIAQMYVDALDDAFVSASRELEFIHDQSDLLYVRDLPA